MLLPFKKSLLPNDFIPAILAGFPQHVPTHRNFAVFHGQAEAPFLVFPYLLSGTFSKNNYLFLIRW